MRNFAICVMLVTGCIMSCGFAAETNSLPINSHPETDAYNGWHLAIQAWSFNRYTFFEAIDKTASLGLHYIEAYPGQRLSKEKPEIRFDHNASAEVKKEVKQKLSDAGVRLINYGVVDLPNNEAECRKVFDFAKEMGIETIVSEPTPETMELVDKLCKEYNIKVAIHNHPKPSFYWNYEKVIEVCKGRSPSIGSCADAGHWMRGSLNPVEAVKKLEGRIISFHLKDLNEFGKPDAHDVPWGTGKADIPAILAELNRQKFKGVFSIEYEYNWNNSVPDIRKSIEYFNAQAAKLNPSGWVDLFAPDLSNCTYKPDTWVFADGVLSAKKDDFIWTKEKYGNYILDLEFKVDKGSNSGIFLRCGSMENWLNTSIELQVLDSAGKEKPDKHDCGAIYDILEPTKNMMKPAGEWNRCTITCKDNKIYVVLNGQQIIDMDLDRWTQAGKNPDGTPNKFSTAYKDMPRTGFVGLQGVHGGEGTTYYRNLKIKKLPG